VGTNSPDSGQESGIRDWFRRLSLIRKLIAGVLAIATAIITIVGAVEATGKVIQWWSSRSKEPTALVRSPWLGLQIWQNGTRNDMSLGDRYASTDRLVRVPMSNDPFEIRLPKPPKDVGIQVCAWTDDSIFSLKQGIDLSSPRARRGSAQFFALGTGMAETAFGTGRLMLNKGAHNYYIDNRVETSDGQSIIYVSSVVPPRQYPDMPKIPMPSVRKKTPATELNTNIFLTVLVDGNSNYVIDNEEYQYVKLEF
jgi:hypothetical protein